MFQVNELLLSNMHLFRFKGRTECVELGAGQYVTQREAMRLFEGDIKTYT